MSSISKTPSFKNMTNESLEESGWTIYFDDFFNNNHNIMEDGECNSLSFSGVDTSSTSLVSDAASLAAQKLAENFPMSKNGNRSLSLKKRKKIRTVFVDDSLEDTASSPVNSPKVSFDNQLWKEKQKKEIDFSQEKGNTSEERDERKELSLNEKNSECTELKKKGLCLVPLSMLVNYVG
ncbi:hypothetical protein Lal_00045937 [Lupinus albus]|uniref:Uncharacterized protein n=1 Tax=Lupinus albus TaxID=3870 RepID=A0A6A5NSV0_LUPAL|nr:hypothetical protein Lalb_Chr14g0367581 [Lupinus albus]KAF1886702.1 hypothetical protein Lal_00045937 [Lupinus albus]